MHTPHITCYNNKNLEKNPSSIPPPTTRLGEKILPPLTHTPASLFHHTHHMTQNTHSNSTIHHQPHVYPISRLGLGDFGSSTDNRLCCHDPNLSKTPLQPNIGKSSRQAAYNTLHQKIPLHWFKRLIAALLIRSFSFFLLILLLTFKNTQSPPQWWVPLHTNSHTLHTTKHNTDTHTLYSDL